jgi:hypothetical protein
MKTIRSKLWSVVSGNQTVSGGGGGGGGGGRDQNQSIPDFVRGYNKRGCHNKMGVKYHLRKLLIWLVIIRGVDQPSLVLY